MLTRSVTGWMTKKNSIELVLDAAYLKRARSIPQEQLQSSIEQVIYSLHQALDGWRYHDQPLSDVRLCVDAMNALLMVVEERQTKPL